MCIFAGDSVICVMCGLVEDGLIFSLFKKTRLSVASVVLWTSFNIQTTSMESFGASGVFQYFYVKIFKYRFLTSTSLVIAL